MGCDIHVHFEIKLNGKWEHYSQPRIRRNYELFGKIAGARASDIKPIHSPRGLPADCSIMTKFCSDTWGVDGHTHGWLDATEIMKIMFFHEHITKNKMIAHEEWGYLFGGGWNNFLEFRQSYPEEIEDIRMIFWFDN